MSENMMDASGNPITLFIECPHCGTSIEIVKLNCRIFRCGVYKKTGKQINPHLPKEDCDRLCSEDAIYGCGKPFRITEDECIVEKCDYI